ncbi:hypothetical protein [Sinorhizobium americanum]|uniref:Helix-turn-helix domain-containing protein n=1 Tax=Sinorhizobium americanum TaxID=194963 RepID=A0A4R2BTK1_9HYPH|nr:hypothetical protein [Sinorhizobium americanum]TCN30142.1 hypothetical protein EV184_1088 [Sinorhizobium americanum]
MTIYQRGKPLRNWLVSTEEAAKAIHVPAGTLRSLSAEGFIQPGARKGFYRLGSVIDGHAEAVRVGRLPAPHARATAPATMKCSVEDR